MTSPTLANQRPRVRLPRPWLMLALGVLGQASSTVFVSTPAFLIPLLHGERGLSLAQAGLLASAPTLGLVLTLIAWGALSDRIGERAVIAAGLAITAIAAAAATLAASPVALGALLVVGGMAAASPNAASGRVVIGWFPKERRGLAMGIRQMCQPLGVAIAAVTIPLLAATGGIALALLLPALLCGAAAVLCALALVDPPRPPRGEGKERAPGSSSSPQPASGDPGDAVAGSAGHPSRAASARGDGPVGSSGRSSCAAPAHGDAATGLFGHPAPAREHVTGGHLPSASAARQGEVVGSSECSASTSTARGDATPGHPSPTSTGPTAIVPGSTRGAVPTVPTHPPAAPAATPPTTPPPNPHAPWHPYRDTALLWRIHGVSMLLVVPQFALSTFGLVWLVAELRFSALAAGIVIGVSQFVGAVGRIGVGVLSDRVGSRLRPLRWVSLAAVGVMLLMAVAAAFGSVGAAVVLVVAAVVTVADNGLAYTSVAEIAGPFWSGRALGAQNTGQFLVAAAVGPAVGALIGWVGYPLAFAAVALCPALAVPLVPRERELAAVPE